MAARYGLGLKRPSAIPGFGLALGFTLTYLSLIVLIPLAALVLKSATLGLTGFWEVVTGPRTLAALPSTWKERPRRVRELVPETPEALDDLVIKGYLVYDDGPRILQRATDEWDLFVTERSPGSKR